jgi:hypothetical protein
MGTTQPKGSAKPVVENKRPEAAANSAALYQAQPIPSVVSSPEPDMKNNRPTRTYRAATVISVL